MKDKEYAVCTQRNILSSEKEGNFIFSSMSRSGEYYAISTPKTINSTCSHMWDGSYTQGKECRIGDA